jgi:hypothetical protein
VLAPWIDLCIILWRMHKESILGTALMSLEHPYARPPDPALNRAVMDMWKKVHSQGLHLGEAILHENVINLSNARDADRARKGIKQIKAEYPLGRRSEVSPNVPKSVGRLMRVRRYTGPYSSMGTSISVEHPKRLTPFEGHELGHIIRSTEEGEKLLGAKRIFSRKYTPYNGDRGFLGFFADSASSLRSEADASNEILRRLPREAQRKYGPELFGGYSSYHTDSLPPSSVPIERKLKVLAHRLLQDRGGYKRHVHDLNQILSRYNHKEDTPRDIRIKAKGRARTQEIETYIDLIKKRQRYQKRSDWDSVMRTEEEVGKLVEQIQARHVEKLDRLGPRIADRNKRFMLSSIDKIIRSTPGSIEAIKKDILSDIRLARKTFGPSTGLGVARSARSLIEEFAKLYPNRTDSLPDLKNSPMLKAFREAKVLGKAIPRVGRLLR